MPSYLFWHHGHTPRAAPWAWHWTNRQPDLLLGPEAPESHPLLPDRAPGPQTARTAYDLYWSGAADLLGAAVAPRYGGGIHRVRWERRVTRWATYDIKALPIPPSAFPVEIGSLVPDRAPGPERAAATAYGIRPWPVELYGGKPEEVLSLLPDRAPGASRTAAPAYGIRPWPVELYGGAPPSRLFPDQAPGAKVGSSAFKLLVPGTPDLYTAPIAPYYGGGVLRSLRNPHRWWAPQTAYGIPFLPVPPAAVVEALPEGFGAFPHRVLSARLFSSWSQYGVLGLPERPIEIGSLLPDRAPGPKAGWSAYTLFWYGATSIPAETPPPRPIEIGYLLPNRAPGPQTARTAYTYGWVSTVDLGVPAIVRYGGGVPRLRRWERWYAPATAYGLPSFRIEEAGVQEPSLRTLLPERAPGQERSTADAYQLRSFQVELYGSQVPSTVRALLPDRAPGVQPTVPGWFLAGVPDLYTPGGVPIEIRHLLPERAPGRATPLTAYQLHSFQVELYGAEVPLTVRPLFPDRAPGAQTAKPGWFLAGGPDLYPLAPRPTGFGHLLPDRAPGPATARTAYQLVPFPVELYGEQVATTVRALFAERAPGRSIASTAFQLWAYPQVGEYPDVPVTVLRLFPDRAPGPQTARSAYIFFGRELEGVPLIIEIGTLVPDRAPGPRAGGSAYTLFQPGVLDLYLPVLPRPIEIGNLMPNRAPGRATAVTAYLLPSAAPPPNHPFGSHPWWVPPPIMIGKHDEVSP